MELITLNSNSEQDIKVDCPSNIDSIIKLNTCEWTISNYSLISHLAEVTSPNFMIGQNNEAMKFRLSQGSDKNLKIEISLQKAVVIDLCKSKTYVPFNKVEVKLEFLDTNGKILDYYVGLPFELVDINNIKHYSWTKEENVSRFIEHDVLKFRVKLSLRYHFSSFEEEPLCSKSVELLANDMKKLIRSNLFSDLSIKVGNKCFLTHKCILLPQFAYIEKFSSELKVDQSGICAEKFAINTVDCLKEGCETICIPNENSEVFLSILHYLYSGDICTSDAFNDFSLYEFAQKYRLYELSSYLTPEEMHSRSQVMSSKMNFTWHVRKYTVHSLDKFNRLQSPVYKTRVGAEEISWNMSVYFFDSQSIFISLQRVEGFYSDVQTTFKLIICNPGGTFHEQREFKRIFRSRLPCGYPGFLDPESRFSIDPNLLFDDTLTIRCELAVSGGLLISDSLRIYPGQFTRLNLNSWIKNLRNLLETGNFSDISLLVGETETEFKVHKIILSVRSPVFARMFETNMKEKSSSSVKIEGISSTAMKCALTYIYTARLDVLNMHDTVELYRLADMYEILELKDRCAEFIMDNLDVDSACEVLILSDLCDDVKMKEAANEMICRNASQALLTSCGKELMVNYPLLAGEVLDKLSLAFLSLDEIH